MNEPTAISATTMTRHIPTDEEIDRIRSAGKQLVAQKQVRRDLEKQIEGMEWGSGNTLVKGSGFSPATRAAFAEFCVITRANPLIHVDVLGAKPYLNAQYFEDLLNTEERFVRYEQRDVSISVEEGLLARAKKHLELAKTFEESDPEQAALRRPKAFDFEERAEDVRLARQSWSPRESASVVIETTIFKFMNAAPIALWAWVLFAERIVTAIARMGGSRWES